MRIASKTDKGLTRSNNQDSFVAGPIGENAAWAVVCDGMGGANGGNIASSIAVKAISDSVISSFRTNMSSNSIRNLFESALSAANVKIINRAKEDEELTGMGTTVVAAVICNGVLHVFHIGDSRAYLIRNGEISRITRDHSIIQSMIEQGEIDEEQAKTHPSKNIITKALGANERLDPDYNEIDFFENDILLICSDGLTNYVDEQVIKEIVLNNDFPTVPNLLIDEANKNGGGDNITAVLLSY